VKSFTSFINLILLKSYIAATPLGYIINKSGVPASSVTGLYNGVSKNI